MATVPWLMLPRTKDDVKKGVIRFYSIEEEEAFPIQIQAKEDDFGHPPNWRHCLNSSGEWLMVIDDMSNLHMLNPLTGDHIPLPPFSTFPDVIPIKDDAGSITHYTLAHKYPHVKFPAYAAAKIYLNKAIVGWTSPSTYIVLAVHSGPLGRLSFTRSGDEAWTDLVPENVVSDKTVDGVQDIIFHKGRFRALLRDGNIATCDLRSHHDSKVTIAATRCVDKSEKSELCNRYLLRLSGKLFQVIRFARSSNFEFMRHLTRRIEAYKKVGHDWVKVKHLGGHSLFLDDNSVISLSPCSSTAVRGNCIYFSDSYCQQPRFSELETHDIGIFNIEDGSFSTCYPSESNLTCPPPVWFMPNSSSRLVGNLREMETEGEKHTELGEEKIKMRGEVDREEKEEHGKTERQGGKKREREHKTQKAAKQSKARRRAREGES